MLIFPPLIVTALSTGGAFLVPRMYESSTKLLIQQAEVVNPLTTLANAMSTTNDDPLRYFDEIIYSDRTVNALVDSLGLSTADRNDPNRMILVADLKKNIQTKTQLRESFSITYQDKTPMRAKRGAELLASIFIQTVSSAKNKKNDLTVQFYEQKLQEFRDKFEQSQKEVVAALRGRGQAMVGPNALAYTRLDQLEQQLRDAKKVQSDDDHRLQLLGKAQSLMTTEEGRQRLFELQRSGVPFAEDLKPLLTSLEDVTQKYTPKHPEVLKIETQISAVLDRMSIAVQADLRNQQSTINDFEKTRSETIDQIMQSSVVQQEDRDKQSNYNFYERLYNEMKGKLEEAEISRALGKDGENQFIVIDPAYVPLFPSKPSRVAIIGGGFGFGILLSVLSTIIAEILDTTIWKPREIEVYQKPIIGLLPEAKRKE